ncbi:ABC transporter ATP-binding protein [Allonocardiopsis opalescens]|uniref:ABC transporter ATP-binding protein n=1 Tax=Allonocardiopsis opalescens TaxID=1144618 RepID=UPI003184376B
MFTVIIRPNGCGKSTLPRALSRLLKPKAGTVYLDGKDIQRSRAKDVATRLGLPPQTAIAPAGITVFDLVRRPRTGGNTTNPHDHMTTPRMEAQVGTLRGSRAARTRSRPKVNSSAGS